ncbi:hypothetical protein SAMN05192582_101368 [Bacteroides ovatus]|uniref:Uncharacterized protein n=1 Tax=Bacteroides ovatus TaxID=28116 RepID=A0A1G8FAF9_BACOV|nr:hypothetical protein SAMN05192582_101368 [Bacteroides ovatus]
MIQNTIFKLTLFFFITDFVTLIFECEWHSDILKVVPYPIEYSVSEPVFS